MTTDYQILQAASRERLPVFANKAFELIEPGTRIEWGWHLDCIAEHLQGQFEGEQELRWLIINVPPRCLKSVLVAQIYPAWAMGREPHHQFIGASYAHSLAERNVMKCRQIMQHEWYMDAFPKTRISQDQNQKDYFTTSQSGAYKGTGVGGTVTGFGCKSLLLDDILNPKEAASDTVRVNTINEMRSTLFSRFNNYNEGRMTLIMQRLHEMDPTGDLLKDGGYYHLKLPAENKGKTITYGLHGKSWAMETGDLLTNRLDKSALEKLRMDLTEYNYVGQYLQDPVPLGGGEFREEWLQWYQPGGVKPKEMNVCILVDAAGGEDLNKKKKKTSDWTVMCVVGLAPDNNYYLLDMIRDRLNPTDRIDTLFMLHRKWNDLCGKPPKVGYEKYGMMTDTHYIREKQKQDAYNFAIVELGGQTMKEERIRRLIPDMQNGRWFYPGNLQYVDAEGRKFDLITEMKGEMKSFPRARYDDILDAKSRIYDVELYMTFPKQRANMVGRAMRSAARSAPDNWENW